MKIELKKVEQLENPDTDTVELTRLGCGNGCGIGMGRTKSGLLWCCCCDTFWEQAGYPQKEAEPKLTIQAGDVFKYTEDDSFRGLVTEREGNWIFQDHPVYPYGVKSSIAAIKRDIKENHIYISNRPNNGEVLFRARK